MKAINIRDYKDSSEFRKLIGLFKKEIKIQRKKGRTNYTQSDLFEEIMKFAYNGKFFTKEEKGE